MTRQKYRTNNVLMEENVVKNFILFCIIRGLLRTCNIKELRHQIIQCYIRVVFSGSVCWRLTIAKADWRFGFLITATQCTLRPVKILLRSLDRGDSGSDWMHEMSPHVFCCNHDRADWCLWDLAFTLNLNDGSRGASIYLHQRGERAQQEQKQTNSDKEG